MAEQMRQQLRNDPDLQDVFPAEVVADVMEILCSEEETLEALQSQLPPNQSGEPLTSAEILEHIQSPEFQSACTRLSAVFRGGEAQALYSELGLNTANMRIGVRAFLDAIIERYGPE